MASGRVKKVGRPLRLTCQEFMALDDYSASYPTGTTTGKRWRRLDGAFDPRRHLPLGHPARIIPRWFIVEYGEPTAGGERIALHWYDPVIVVTADEQNARVNRTVE